MNLLKCASRTEGPVLHVTHVLNCLGSTMYFLLCFPSSFKSTAHIHFSDRRINSCAYAFEPTILLRIERWGQTTRLDNSSGYVATVSSKQAWPLKWLHKFKFKCLIIYLQQELEIELTALEQRISTEFSKTSDKGENDVKEWTPHHNHID